MIPRKGADGQAPSPELLAAYADGELDRAALGALRGQVEAWLATHPEAAAEVAAQRRLRELCAAAAVPEPSEAAWAGVLARVEGSLARTPPQGRRLTLARVLWGGAAAATAAAVWLALTWIPSGDRGQDRPAAEVVQGAPDRQPFPVAAAEEVEVLSVAGADTGSLVVGDLPLQGPMVLAGPGDVTVTSVQSADVILQGPAQLIWARTEGEPQP